MGSQNGFDSHGHMLLPTSLPRLRLLVQEDQQAPAPQGPVSGQGTFRDAAVGLGIWDA